MKARAFKHLLHSLHSLHSLHLLHSLHSHACYTYYTYQARAVPLDEHCVNAALAVCAAAGEADVATRLLRRCSALGAALP